MNKTDGDPKHAGGAYAPKGIKHPAGPKVVVRRVRPVGGWTASPVKTSRHGSAGSIALNRATRKVAAA